MKRFFFFLFIAVTVFRAHGQNGEDSIEIGKKFGTVFMQHGKCLSNNNLLAITKTNPEAYKELKTAHRNFISGVLVASAVGCMVAIIGINLDRRETKWTLMGIGVGMVVSIPTITTKNKRVKNAVRIYNRGLIK